MPLKPKVFDTLLLLVENRGRVLEKEELLRRLWPDTIVEEANLSQNVYLLRKVLGEDTGGETYIQTMPKRGYRFVAKVNEISSNSAATADSEAPLIQKQQPLPEHHRKRRLGALALAGVLLMFAVGSGLYIWIKSNPNAAKSGAAIKSIAVLPFRPVGSENNDEAMGFAMADTLIIKLSSIRQLTVSQISSVRKFTSPNDDVLAAGRELKVDAVLEASVYRDGDRIRVNLRLISVRDGASLWTRILEERVDDPFAVQDRIAEQVAEELAPQLTGEQRSLLAKRYTQNAEAYRLCMLGRYHSGRPNVADWKKALEYFNRALEKDPRYALAYSGLANAYISLVADSLLPKAEAIPKAKQAALMALELDDTLSDAHVASARIMTYYDWDWAGAEREFRRAIELNTNSSEAHREYAAYLTNVGRSEQAVAEVKQARELDPLTLLTNFQVAWTLIGARRYDEAISESQQLTETFPNAHFWIGLALLGKGMNEQAIKEFETTLSYPKAHSMAKASLGYAYAATGKTEKAKNILAEFEKLHRQGESSPYYLAMIYAGLGDKDQTFAWLEESYRERSRPLASGINVNPMWDGIRSDPRFENLRRRMGLPQVSTVTR
ncbi:MAG TPA: winged helix-turn-helix domain-containing protein [Pyrinomonadaceae bacterium]|nr:winged helix-turn-helix domain-containing protein [Pyrinomonadaceae bacterium]